MVFLWQPKDYKYERSPIAKLLMRYKDIITKILSLYCFEKP